MSIVLGNQPSIILPLKKRRPFPKLEESSDEQDRDKVKNELSNGRKEKDVEDQYQEHNKLFFQNSTRENTLKESEDFVEEIREDWTKDKSQDEIVKDQNSVEFKKIEDKAGISACNSLDALSSKNNEDPF